MDTPSRLSGRSQKCISGFAVLFNTFLFSFMLVLYKSVKYVAEAMLFLVQSLLCTIVVRQNSIESTINRGRERERGRESVNNPGMLTNYVYYVSCSHYDILIIT